MSDSMLIVVAIASIFLLLLLILKFKMQAFVALLITSILVGLAVGMPPLEIVETIEDAMGSALGFIALVIGLGSMFGEVLRVSGGSERLALGLIDKFGEKNIVWALGVSGFLISIAVYIDVAIVILFPILYSIAIKSKKSLLYYGIPLGAGLSVTHTFVPPTPGPIATASIMGADLGWVIIFGVICGIPAMIIAGPMFGKFISKKIFVPVPEHVVEELKEQNFDKELPSLSSVISIIILPLVLILANTSAELLLPEGSNIRTTLMFIGNPVVALLVVCLLTFWLFGTKRGYTRNDIQSIVTKAMEPAGIIILITGAGSVFGEMLVQSGIGDILANAMESANMPLIVFGFLTASIIRIAQGSGTVSMITAASLVAPLIETFDVSAPMLGLITIAIASGGAAFAHVNDSGFWMANRYLNMTVKDTLKSWTVMKSIVGITGFAMSLLLSLFV